MNEYREIPESYLKTAFNSTTHIEKNMQILMINCLNRHIVLKLLNTELVRGSEAFLSIFHSGISV